MRAIGELIMQMMITLLSQRMTINDWLVASAGSGLGVFSLVFNAFISNGCIFVFFRCGKNRWRLELRWRCDCELLERACSLWLGTTRTWSIASPIPHHHLAPCLSLTMKPHDQLEGGEELDVRHGEHNKHLCLWKHLIRIHILKLKWLLANI